MNIVEINLENAKEFLIDESFKRPVLVDFWAEWCAPCKNLMPILEKLANEYAGSFLLAKVNADEMNMISAQFGVRSLPTVILMKDGQPIDGFAGALPEVQVRELLDKYLPKLWEKLVQDAQALIDAGDVSAALPLLRQAYAESSQLAAIAILLAQVHIELNRLDNAEAVLSGINPADQGDEYHALLAVIEEKKQASKSPELIRLEAAFAQNPENLATAFALAQQYATENAHHPALERLLAILRKDKNYADGAVKKAYTEILAQLGKGDLLAIEFQRKLFTLLY